MGEIDDRWFWVLTAISGALFALAIGFALVACLLRWHHDRRAELMSRKVPDWMELVVSVVVGNRDPAAVSGEIAGHHAADFLAILERYAVRLSRRERPMISAIGAPLLARAVGDLPGGPEGRALRVRYEALFGDPPDRDILVGALQDSSPLVAMTAARSLLDSGDREAARIVVRHTHRLRPWSVSAIAAMFGRLPEIAGDLRRRLADRSLDERDRRIAAASLRRMADRDAADAAASVASDRREPTEVRTESLRLLEKVGRPTHREAILGATKDPEPIVRLQAFRALAAVGGADDADRFEAAMRDEVPWLAVHAARGLWQIGAGDRLAAIAEGKGAAATLAREVLRKETREADDA